MNKLAVIYQLALIINISECARILGVFHTPSFSHNAVPNVILEELARKGHDVTVITSIPRKTSVKNLREIKLPGYTELFEDVKLNAFDLENFNFLLAEYFLSSLILNATEELLKHRNVQQLLNSNEKFDVVLLEDFIGHSLKGFAHHFNAPCIMVNSMGISRLVAPEVGNPLNPSYIVDFTTAYSKHMNFYQRLGNSITCLLGELFQHLYVIPRHNDLLQKYFPSPPHVMDIYYNVSLLLLNAHVSVQQPVPYVPNIIDVGGAHVKPIKPLPKDIQEYLDNAKDGAIFFSMGSNLQSFLLDVNKRQAILKAFSKLKQKVLWKFEIENLPDKPPNVKIGKWLPQPDILAHPNVKLFITHGGLLSQIEATHRGVPTLGIPIYGDQRMNLANAELNGLSLSLAYNDINEETFFEKIQELLTNPKYAENAKKHSKIMQDQPLQPLEKAIFWIEYVIRHKGAPHLRTAALNLSWYQYLLLDVILFIVGVIFVVTAVFSVIVKKLLCSKRKPKSKTKKE